MARIGGTVSIVSHGHGSLLQSLLGDLERQQGVEGWRVILTLNVPEAFDRSAFPGLDLHILRNAVPKGFGANHNAAAREASGPLFLIVNPDIRLPSPETLERILKVADTPGPPSLLAPVVVGPDGGREDSVRCNLSPAALLKRALVPAKGWETIGRRTDFIWLAGMFLIVPLETFRALGGFDERYRLYCEDYDLSARWRVSGGRVAILDDVEVIHDARRDSHRSLRHLRWHMGSLCRVWLSSAFWRITLGRYPDAGR